MEFSEIVSIIFRVINFGLVVGLTIYIFRKKFLGQIRSKILQKEIFWKNLHNNKDVLINQQKDLEHDINWQDAYAQQLCVKIDQWHAQMDAYYTIEKKNHLEYIKRAEERRSAQQKYAQMHAITKSIIPPVFKRIGDNLIKTFDDPKRSSQYLAESIDTLTKE